jgi:hypothetical protein
MAEQSQQSDMGTGLGILFGLVAVIAAVATAGTGYLVELGSDGETMQLLSGVAVAVAMAAACLSIVAIHLYD